MLKLDTLRHVPTRLEQTKAVRPEHGKHGVSRGARWLASDEVGFLNGEGRRHQDRLDVYVGEQRLR